MTAGAAWLFVEFVSGYPYSQPWIMYWNATVRLVFFVITAQLISRQKLVHALEHRLSRTDMNRSARCAGPVPGTSLSTISDSSL